MSFHIALKAPPHLQFLLTPCQPPPLKSLPLSGPDALGGQGRAAPLAPAPPSLLFSDAAGFSRQPSFCEAGQALF